MSLTLHESILTVCVFLLRSFGLLLFEFKLIFICFHFSDTSSSCYYKCFKLLDFVFLHREIILSFFFHQLFNCCEIWSGGWNRFYFFFLNFISLSFQIPFYGASGLNAGIMLMNLTRIRSYSNGWVKEVLQGYDHYKENVTQADQDILNIFFYKVTEIE